MNNEEIIKELNIKNSILKDKILQMQNELFEVKHKLNTYQTNSKKYYETNKEKIIERVKNYNKEKKSSITSEKKKEYNRNAYLKRKEKLKNEL